MMASDRADGRGGIYGLIDAFDSSWYFKLPQPVQVQVPTVAEPANNIPEEQPDVEDHSTNSHFDAAAGNDLGEIVHSQHGKLASVIVINDIGEPSRAFDGHSTASTSTPSLPDTPKHILQDSSVKDAEIEDLKRKLEETMVQLSEARSEALAASTQVQELESQLAAIQSIDEGLLEETLYDEVHALETAREGAQVDEGPLATEERNTEEKTQAAEGIEVEDEAQDKEDDSNFEKNIVVLEGMQLGEEAILEEQTTSDEETASEEATESSEETEFEEQTESKEIGYSKETQAVDETQVEEELQVEHTWGGLGEGVQSESDSCEVNDESLEPASPTQSAGSDYKQVAKSIATAIVLNARVTALEQEVAALKETATQNTSRAEESKELQDKLAVLELQLQEKKIEQEVRLWENNITL